MSGTDPKEAPGAGRPPACPVCGKPSAARFRPFCSARCAEIDLGRWFGGTYRVPDEEAGPEDELPG
jgi:hypothetical protein